MRARLARCLAWWPRMLSLPGAEVLPHLYIQVGRDYAGADVSGPELEAMLHIMYPERFADPLTRRHPEFPQFYTFSFLEAAITWCATAGDDLYEADTAAVQPRPRPPAPAGRARPSG